MTTGGGGGAEGGGGIRSQFKTTVLFAPAVVTGADGKAEVEFTLPDNLTTYRIMALAIDRGDRGGKGGSAIQVSKPLLAMPALPRLARVGDTVEAGVVVHAPSGKIKEVQVIATATGPLKLQGETRRTLALPEGKPREVRFRYVAEGPGEAVLRFAVSGGGEQDAVEQRLPVRIPTQMEAVALAGETKDVAREGLSTPSGVRPDVGGLELTMASTVLGGYGEAMRQLVDYPYGCLEQLSSRLVPFVALRELHGVFKLPWRPDSARGLGGRGRHRPLGDDGSGHGRQQGGEGHRGAPAPRRRLRLLELGPLQLAAWVGLCGPGARTRRRGGLRGGQGRAPARAAVPGKGGRGQRPLVRLVGARGGPRDARLRSLLARPDRRAPGLQRHRAVRPALGAAVLREGDARRCAVHRRGRPRRRAASSRPS